MAVIGDERDTGIVCASLYFDLLGYGSLISSSCGTLDSAVGMIALKRIENLLDCYNKIYKCFPKNTESFQFNDSIFASLDLNIHIGSSITDSTGIASEIIVKKEIYKLIKFVATCGKLHQVVIASEEEERLGPAGRSIICIGKRWNINSKCPFLSHESIQANLAVAESYIIDSMGNSAGFNQRCFYNFFVNDMVWFVLKVAKASLDSNDVKFLNNVVRENENFPDNLLSPKVESPIVAKVFHRKREYYSLMSHHVCNIDSFLKGSDL